MNIDHVAQKLDVIIELLRNQTGARSSQPSVTVTEALVLRPLLEDRGRITESVRILVPVDRMKKMFCTILQAFIIAITTYTQFYVFYAFGFDGAAADDDGS